MKILLLGLYYSENKGDALLTDCVAARIRRSFPDSELTVCDLFGRTGWKTASGGEEAELKKRIFKNKLRTFASNYTPWDKMYSHEQYLYEMHRADIERVMSISCDCVVFAGGQLFMDDLALVVSSYIDHFAAMEIPVIINAAGWGPFCSRHIRERLAQSLQNRWTIDLSVRDHASAISRLVGRKVPERADFGLFADITYGIHRDPQSNRTGLGIMYAPTISRGKMIRFWEGLILQLARKGIAWTLFTNGYPSDEEFARDVLKQLPEECFNTGKNRRDYLLPSPGTPREMTAQISSFQSLISMRLHSHIVAASLEIPSVAITWDDKLPEFFRMLGYPERCLSILESADQVISMITQAQRDGIDRATVNALREAADKSLVSSIRKAADKSLLTSIRKTSDRSLFTSIREVKSTHSQREEE